MRCFLRRGQGQGREADGECTPCPLLLGQVAPSSWMIPALGCCQLLAASSSRLLPALICSQLLAAFQLSLAFKCWLLPALGCFQLLAAPSSRLLEAENSRFSLSRCSLFVHCKDLIRKTVH